MSDIKHIDKISCRSMTTFVRVALPPDLFLSLKTTVPEQEQNVPFENIVI